MAWYEDAECAGNERVTFIAPDDGQWDPQPALALCALCPVRDECLADRPTGSAGVWGGRVFGVTKRNGRHTSAADNRAASAAYMRDYRQRVKHRAKAAAK